jgi:membrane protease YdiL (CAAX protease family)
MSLRPFAGADPFLQLIVLFLLSFVSMSLFLLMAQGLISFLWGVDLFTQLQGVQDFTNPSVVNINRLSLLFQHLGLFIAPAFLFSRLMSNSSLDFLSVRRPKIAVLAAGAIAMILALPLINALAWVNEQLSLPDALKALEAVFAEMEESAAQLTKAITHTTDPFTLLFNILIIAVVPAIGEELIFRGIILPIFIKWTGRLHLSVWLSAALFSAMHMQFYGFIPRMILGALLGYLFVWSKNIWSPILAHFANNFMALIFLFLIARGDIDPDLDSFDPSGTDLIALGVSVALLVPLLWWLYKRKEIAESTVVQTDETTDREQ